MCEHPEEWSWMVRQLAHSLSEPDTIAGFLSPDYAGTFVAIAVQQFFAFCYEKYIPLYRFQKNGTFASDFSAQIPEKRFVIIEDVVVTGTSVFPLFRYIQQGGGVISDVIAIVNRPHGGREWIRELHAQYHVLYEMDDIS
jgi:orotate phosphoribosyltransferase